MFKYSFQLKMGFTFIVTPGGFLFSVPLIGMVVYYRSEDSCNNLFFGYRWGVRLRFNLVSILLGGREWHWSPADLLFGGGTEHIQPLADPETIRTSDGMFVIQHQRRYRVRAGFYIFDRVVGYQVISSPFDLGCVDFFTLDDPMKVIIGCRNMAGLLEDLRLELNEAVENSDEPSK